MKHRHHSQSLTLARAHQFLLLLFFLYLNILSKMILKTFPHEHKTTTTTNEKTKTIVNERLAKSFLVHSSLTLLKPKRRPLKMPTFHCPPSLPPSLTPFSVCFQMVFNCIWYCFVTHVHHPRQ